MLKFCKLLRPKKKSGGMEVKLLVSRVTCSRRVRLAKVGKSPERKLRWTARLLSWESWLMSGGRVPVRDLEAMFMDVTRLDLSQFIPSHVQKSVPVQVVGAGERVLAKLCITAASSAAVKERRRKKVRQSRRR